MKLTLRKANVVQSSINEILKNMDFSTTIKLNEFQDPEQVLMKTHENFMTSIDRRDKLLSALHEIRALVGVANSTSGIDLLLTKSAHFEKQIQFYTSLCQISSVREDMLVIKGKLEKIRTRKDEARIYREDEITTGLLVQEDIDKFKEHVNTLKKSKQKLQDEVLELNVRTEIDISQFVQDLLISEGII